MQDARIELQHADLTDRIIGGFYDVYNTLGHGYLESVYEEATVICLGDSNLCVERQLPITVYFRGRPVGTFKADIVVESCVVVELKASRAVDPAHEAQLLNYLRASKLEVGLLLNFGVRPAFRRFVFANERKAITAPRRS